MLGLHCCAWAVPQLQQAGGHCRVAVLRLPTVVVSLAEHGLSGTHASVVAAPGLQSTGSVVAGHGFSCSAACGSFPDQGSNPSPALASGFFTTESAGKPCTFFCFNTMYFRTGTHDSVSVGRKGPRSFL